MGIRPFSRPSTRRITIFSWSRSRSRSATHTSIAFRNSDPTREATGIDPHNATLLALAQANRQAMGIVDEFAEDGNGSETQDSGMGSSLMLSARASIGSGGSDSWYTATGESMVSTPPRSPFSSTSHITRPSSFGINTSSHPFHFTLPTTAEYNDNFEEEYASINSQLQAVHIMAEFEALTRRRAILLAQQSAAEWAVIGTGGTLPTIRASEIVLRSEAQRLRSLWGTNHRMALLQRNSPIPVVQYTAVAATQMWECCVCGFLAMPVGRDGECLGEGCGHERCGGCWVFRPTWEEWRGNRFDERRREREGEWWTGGRRGPPGRVEVEREDEDESEPVQTQESGLPAARSEEPTTPVIEAQDETASAHIVDPEYNDLYDISPRQSPEPTAAEPAIEEEIPVSA